MKKRVARILSLLLAFTITSISLSGCSKNESVSESESGSASGSESAASVASGDPVELTVEVFDRGTQGQAPLDNNYLTQYVQKNFGDKNNIKVTYVTVPRTQEVDKLNVLMASNTAPDICFTYDNNAVYNYVNQGGLTDLTSYLDEYGAELTKYLGEEVLSYGVFSGIQYAVPAKRIIKGMGTSLIRKDWLDALNLKVPTTTEEFYNYLVQVKEKKPGGAENKSISFGMSAQWQNTTHLLQSFLTEMSDEEYSCLPSWSQPGFKEGMKYLNKLYSEGLISQDFAIDKDMKKLDADVSNGQVGSVIYNTGYPYMASSGIAASLEKNVTGAKLVPCDPFTNYEGKHPKSLYTPIGLINFVPKFSKHAAEAIKYLDWMSNLDALLYVEYGEKDVDYTLENGIPKIIVQTGDRKINNGDYTIIVNGKELGDTQKNIDAQKSSCPGYEDLFVQSVKMSTIDAINQPHFDRGINADIKYSKTLATLSDSMYVKLIMADPKEFDKTYEDCLADYLSQGGQEVIDEKTTVYKEMNKK